MLSPGLKISTISWQVSMMLETMEKNVLFEEVKTILKDSFKLECDMLNKTIDLENNIISFLINERAEKLREIDRERMKNEISDQIEKDLIEIMLN